MLGSDNMIYVWNCGTGEALSAVDCHPDIPLCVAWNNDGSRIVTSCKDKKVRVINPRTGEVLSVSILLIQNSRIAWC